MIKLSKKEEEIIFNTNYGSIIINDKKYFYKFANKKYAGIEIALERLAKSIGLNTAHYEIVKIYNSYYYLSEDINSYGNFKLATVLDLESNDYGSVDLYYIWDELEKKYPLYSKELLNDIIKLYIFDILFINDDRHLHNYGFLEKEDKVSLYIFDNSNSFDDSMTTVLSSKILDDDNYILDDNNIVNNILDLKEFLNTSSNEYIDLFNNIINILKPEYINKVFEKVALEYDLKDFNVFEFESLYKRNYDLIQIMMNNRGLK